MTRRPRADEGSPLRREIEDYRAEEVTAREGLRRARDAAIEKQRWQTGWLLLFGFGPATLVAILLAVALRRSDLVVGFAGLGLGVQLWRIWRQRTFVQHLARELEDPIDGS